VVPRVLFAGQIDPAKVRYFLEEGALIVTAADGLTWRGLSEPAPVGAVQARAVRRALMATWWRERWLQGPARPALGLSRAVFHHPKRVGIVALLLVATAGLGVVPWWTLLAPLGVLMAFLLVSACVLVPLDGVHRRASELLTGLARDEAAFLRFGLERKLMQIAPSWHLNK
jgi:hypothetical protein